MIDPADARPALARRRFTGAVLALAATPPASWATSGEAPAAPSGRPRLVAAGGPVLVEGRDELVAEVHVDWPADSAPPTALRLLDEDRGDVFEAFDGTALAPRLARIDGQRLVCHVELSSAPGRPLPGRLRPVLWAGVDAAGTDAARADRVLAGEALTLPGPAAPVFGAPLGDGLWVAIHDPSWARGHRRVGFQRADRWTIPGRHAIDFVRVDEDGRIARGDPDRPAHHLGHGAPVLAVAAGVVTAARDGMAEAASVAGNPRHPLADAPGNHVVLSLDGGRHVIYEHLRPGSLTVRPGDRVRRGQVLGALGFTGDSTGPHLHLHLCDEAAPNAGEGLPFVFERFERLGGYDDLALLGKARWRPAPEGEAILRRSEKPAPHRVIRFPAA